MVFNNAAREHLKIAGANLLLPGHDWWTYLAIMAVGGQAHYEPIPLVRYRVHGQNAVGSNVGLRNKFRRLRMLGEGHLHDWIELNIAALERLRPEMLPANRAILDLFCQYRNRGFISRQIGLYKTGVYRQTRWGNIGLIIAAATNKL
jgi:hypothetical protein